MTVRPSRGEAGEVPGARLMYPSPEASASGIASRLPTADTCAWVTVSSLSSVESARADTGFPLLSTAPVVGVHPLPLEAKMTVGMKASDQMATPATIPSGPTQMFLVPSV